jgi:hypothetical protein
MAFRPTIARGSALSTMCGFKLFLLYSTAISMPERVFSTKLLILNEDIQKLNFEGRRKVPICVKTE